MTINRSQNDRQIRNFASIQILRGIAALLVVLFHLSTVPEILPLFGGQRPSFLVVGVDIFFVISGFVMMHSAMGKKLTPGSFLLNRCVRVVPPYWAALTVTLVILYLLRGNFPSLTNIFLSYMFIPHMDPFSGEPAPFLNVGWTLNYEMFFYCVFALTLGLSTGMRIVCLLVLFTCLVCLRPIMGDETAIALRITSPLLYEFLFGMVIRTKLDWLLKVTGASGPALIAVGFAAVVTCDLFFPQMPRFLAFGVPAAVIVVGCLSWNDFLARPQFKYLHFVGDASYSIYVFHVPIMMVAVPLLAGLNGFLLFPILAGLILAGASAAYAFIERPLVNSLKSGLSRSGAKHETARSRSSEA